MRKDFSEPVFMFILFVGLMGVRLRLPKSRDDESELFSIQRKKMQQANLEQQQQTCRNSFFSEIKY